VLVPDQHGAHVAAQLGRGYLGVLFHFLVASRIPPAVRRDGALAPRRPVIASR
jgi:hypothetical protein